MYVGSRFFYRGGKLKISPAAFLPSLQQKILRNQIVTYICNQLVTL
jgi:hypothetical protein